MATSTTSKKTVSKIPLVKNGLTFVWLDDNAGQDPGAKEIFLPLFEQVFIFADPIKCLELVESAQDQPPCISILITGSLGEKLVHDRLQPLQQVKHIYVFCFNIPKHKQWATNCDKVRCVESDFKKILHHIQQDVLGSTEQSTENPPTEIAVEEIVTEQIEREVQRFTDDNNLYDQLALDVLLQHHEDGEDDFKKYCQHSHQGENDYKIFRSDKSIRDWYNDSLVFLQLNSKNFNDIWMLRWFIQHFYRQIKKEHENLIAKEREITVNYATWLSENELTNMKRWLGQSIISTRLIHTYIDKNNALKSIGKRFDQAKSHRVLMQIDVDTSIHSTVPYGEIRNGEVLFFFGSRFEILKLELIKPHNENEDLYWLIGMNLSPTFDVNPRVETLYQYYLDALTKSNDLYHAFGRILMYKGLYIQAEKWFQTGNYRQELAEIAIHRNQIERAQEYLDQLPDSDDINILRACTYLLTSNDNISKGRTLLMKISSEASDRLVRARVNIILGFIHLIILQQIDQALDYFQIGNENLRKKLPAIHPDIAKSWIGIGYTYFTQHKKDEAEKAFREAWKIQQQSLISNHPDFAKTHNGLAHCFSTEKQTIKQALTELESAFDILIQTFPRDYKTHPEFMLTQQDYEKIRKGKDLRARNTLLDYI